MDSFIYKYTPGPFLGHELECDQAMIHKFSCTVVERRPGLASYNPE